MMKSFTGPNHRKSGQSAGTAILAVSLVSLFCILLFHLISGPPAAETGNAAGGSSGFAAEGYSSLGQSYEPFDIFRMEDADFTAVILSDLHFSSGRPMITSDTAPQQSRIEAITLTFLAETAAIRPDVLILCGDNTDIGDQPSMEQLYALLSETEASGIPVVLCPGNHDYGISSAEDYRRCFEPLLHADDSDSTTLSYSRRIGNCRLFSLDDNYEGNGIYGSFPDATLEWLDAGLEAAAAAGEMPIVITHHNLFRGTVPEHEENYVIQNPELTELLKKHRVKLVFSGHRHGQEIIHPDPDSPYEIISGFPSSYPFYFGVLKVTGGSIRYQAQSIDFAAYGAEYGTQDLSSANAELPDSQSVFAGAIDSMLEGQALSRKDKEAIRSLFLRFTDLALRAEIAEHKEEILKDPMYHKMMMALKDSNYARWIQYVMEHAELPGYHLELDTE